MRIFFKVGWYNAYYFSLMASSNNCCRHLCFAYKLCHRVQRIEFWGFLVDFMLLMRNKNRKNRKFENLVILTFCTFFKKCLVDVRQNLSLFIEFRGFHFSPPPGFNAIHAFNMRFHVLKRRIAIILLPIFDKLQFVVSICQKASQGIISCCWN